MYEKVDKDIFDGDERLTIMNEMRAFYQKNRSFNPSFLDSVEDVIEGKGKISKDQYNGLVNIFYSFKMDEEK